jgi:hypothetical protein
LACSWEKKGRNEEKERKEKKGKEINRSDRNNQVDESGSQIMIKEEINVIGKEKG